MPRNNIRTIHKVDLGLLRASPWRYSRQTSTDRKLAYVLKLRGQTMPILVRDIKTPVGVQTGGIEMVFSHHEIIDGHRVWEALKSNGNKACTVVSVGEVSDVEAMLMTLESNESRGPIDQIALAYFFKHLHDAGIHSDEISSRIDFDTEQVEGYRELATFDLDAFSKGESGTGQVEMELMPEDIR